MGSYYYFIWGNIMRLLYRFPLLNLLFISMVSAALFYVSPDGDDSSGDGSSAAPWATIDYAVAHIPSAGGDTIIVKDGLYNGRNYITESFDNWIVIAAENVYRAKLTNIQNETGGEAFGIFTPGSAKIIAQGFIISNADDNYKCAEREENVLIHFQDACDIIFQNNIVFGNNIAECCNELLKINRGSEEFYPRNIHVRGNVFYDHVSSPGADIIDAVRPGELDIYENIFFTRSSPNAQSFITLKRQVQEADIPDPYKPARNPRHKVHKNIFLNWDGKSDQAFIQFGEDGQNELMITNSLIENNLMIGNSSHPIVAAVQLKGAKNITVRANTITGDLPGSTYGFRIGTEGDNPPVDSFFITNNIWSDPTGSMTNRFINTYGDVDVSSITLYNNLFYNTGNSLPDQGSVLPSADPNLITGNPGLEENQENIILPVWDEDTKQFPSGNRTIRKEFERLVLAYGVIPAGSPVINRADSSAMPADDILGNKRDSLPDIGCLEYNATVDITSESNFLPPCKQPFQVFTNKNTVRIQVLLPGKKYFTFQILNVSGQKLWEYSNNSGLGTIVLPLHKLTSGVYLAVLKQDSEFYMQKVLVSR